MKVNYNFLDTQLNTYRGKNPAIISFLRSYVRLKDVGCNDKIILDEIVGNPTSTDWLELIKLIHRCNINKLYIADSSTALLMNLHNILLCSNSIKISSTFTYNTKYSCKPVLVVDIPIPRK